VTVIGIGVSKTPAKDLLLNLGARVTAFDKKSADVLGLLGYELTQKGANLSLGDGYLDHIRADYIFRSPGVRPDNEGILKAISKGAVLTSEMEEFFELCPCPIIGVTGSDGKTTTTTIISEILKADGKNVFVGGNIGVPLLPKIDEITPDDYVVVELSSFQLLTMKKSPHISVITNITPNHLNWHKDMQEYVDAKLNIVRYQHDNDISVINYNNGILKDYMPGIPGNVRCFSGTDSAGLPAGSIHVSDGYICVGDEKVLAVSDIRIPGEHNVENYMAAIGAIGGLVKKECIQKVAKEFGGVEHRIEFVREVYGVKYFNSSIDSSPTRTIAAINAFNQKLIVICGGYDKKVPYDPIGRPLCEKAKAVIVTGDTGPLIKQAILDAPIYKKGNPDIYEASNYSEAIEIARDIAMRGDIVLLSPASASFDSFKNFEERGRFFKEKVMSF
ncbi:MAG: UDP-N-acetylmuramoyl-L-alanine--D-glutamate ligase, partial [Clostridia bacterium]|nr:UDP-N-acetylmuramoyl-L-alanine--D-glutamate ligase [Clostridia bacterium]